VTDPLPHLVDSHCHLTWPTFAGDFDAVLARMRAAGVAQAVVVATTPENSTETLALCDGREGLYPTAGLHPNDVPDGWDPRSLAEVLGAADGRFVAVGETGLDYYRDAVPPARQQQAFEAQIDLARRHDLPVIVHIRDKDGRWAAYDDVATTLERAGGVRGVIHCYTGDPAHAERYLAAGFYVSFSGILTFPKGENVRAAARSVPLARTLVETDAPFLAPLPERGARNEPGFVAHTCAALARLKAVPEAEARATTAANARALFRLPPAPPGPGSPTAEGGA
jgi:TatD DNase family protein